MTLKTKLLPLVCCLIAFVAADVPATPVNDSSLLLWLDGSDIDADGSPDAIADGTAVTTWYDKSSTTKYDVASISTSDPTYNASGIAGSSSLTFSVASQTGTVMTNGSLLSAGNFSANEATMFTVYRNPTFPANNHFGITTTGSAANEVDLYLASSYNGDFRNGRLGGLSLSYPQTGTHIKTVQTSAAGWSLYVDGSSVHSTSQAWGLHSTFAVGRSNHGSSSFGGDIAEILIYNRALSVSERDQVTAYLDAKYSTASLQTVDLADIVGGGNGLGTGADAGIEMATGNPTSTHRNNNSGGPANTFHTSTNALVDGVFIPDGGDGTVSVPISSTGLTVTGVPNADANTWDEVWNGHNTGVSSTLTYNSVMGMHRNKGITFDLDAIEAAQGGLQAIEFTADAAFGTAGGTSQYLVYVDGVQKANLFVSGSNNSQPISVDLDPSDRFLTLMTLNGGWAFFGNPEVSLIPEPSTLTMAVFGLLGLLVWGRRRRFTI